MSLRRALLALPMAGLLVAHPLPILAQSFGVEGQDPVDPDQPLDQQDGDDDGTDWLGGVQPPEGEDEIPPAPVTPEALAPESSVDSQAAQQVVDAKGAVLRGLDRVAGGTQDVTIANGGTAQIFRLDVSVSDCRYPKNDPGSNAFAHVTITDRGTQVFDGWMVAASPALSALDHPRYDVWVLGCEDQPGGLDEDSAN